MLSLTSSVGSITDQLSTESPDQESSLSGEVNGVLQEGSDPEVFSVLEVPDPTPDLPNEDGDGRTATSGRSRAGETELHGGASGSPSPGGEGGEGGGAAELAEEPGSADDAPGGRQSPCRERDGSAGAPEPQVLEPDEPQSAFPEAPFLHSPPVPSSLSWAPSAEGWPLGTRADEGSAEEPSEGQGFRMPTGDPGFLGSDPWHRLTTDDRVQKPVVTSECDLESAGGQLPPSVSALPASTHKPRLEQPSRDQALTSSDEEDIYAHGLPSSSSETSMTELGGSRSLQDLSQPAADDAGLLKADQVGGLPEGDRGQTDRCPFCRRKLPSSYRQAGLGWGAFQTSPSEEPFPGGGGAWHVEHLSPPSRPLHLSLSREPESQELGFWGGDTACPGEQGQVLGST